MIMLKKNSSKYKSTTLFQAFTVITGVVLVSLSYLLLTNLPTARMLPDPKFYAGYSNSTAGNVKMDDSLKSKITEMNKSRVIRVHFFNRPRWMSLPMFEECQFKCVVSEKSKDFRAANAVVFHGPRLRGPPPKKSPGHIWVLSGREAPVNYWKDLKNWTNLFNWTMTYRRDSDILYPYGQFCFKVKAKRDQRNELTNVSIIWNTKDKMAAWFVSHCSTSSRRQEYTRLLTKYIGIDVYGKCGDHKCPKSNKQGCWKLLLKRYKFYLSFENAFCLDYITEKAFNLFKFGTDTIPVMRGYGNYSMFFPPGSYINTQDFSTIENLGKQMSAIAASKSKFEEHFAWTKTAYVGSLGQKKWCELCERLHFSHRYKRLYANIHNWLVDKPRSACRTPVDLVRRFILRPLYAMGTYMAPSSSWDILNPDYSSPRHTDHSAGSVS